MTAMSDQNYCEVTENGLAHLFSPLDFGSRCACGRTVFAYGLQDEAPGLRDSSAAEHHSCLIVGRSHVSDVHAATELLLARGQQVIRQARELCASGNARRMRERADKARRAWRRSR